jgi:hypothetical protein
MSGAILPLPLPHYLHGVVLSYKRKAQVQLYLLLFTCVVASSLSRLVLSEPLFLI